MNDYFQWLANQSIIQSRDDRDRRLRRVEEYAPPPGELDWWQQEDLERMRRTFLILAVNQEQP